MARLRPELMMVDGEGSLEAIATVIAQAVAASPAVVNTPANVAPSATEALKVAQKVVAAVAPVIAPDVSDSRLSQIAKQVTTAVVTNPAVVAAPAGQTVNTTTLQGIIAASQFGSSTPWAQAATNSNITTPINSGVAPLTGPSWQEIADANAKVISAKGLSTDPANRLPGETASEANARITKAYKDQPKPELTKEGAAAGATIEWVRTGAGGVGEYKEVYPIGTPIPQTRTTTYGNTYDQKGNLVSGTGLKTTSTSSNITGGGQWLDKNGQLRGDYGPLLNAAVAAGMPVKLIAVFKKDYNLGTLEGQYQAIQDWAFQSGDAPDLAGGKAFIELLGKDRIAKILQGDTSWNQGFTDNYGQPVAGSPMEGRPLFQPYTGKYESTELTDPSKAVGSGLKGKILYSSDPRNPSAETNTYTFPNGFRGTNAEYKAKFNEDPNSILEEGSPEFIKLAQSGVKGIATRTLPYTPGTANTTTLPYTPGTTNVTNLPYTPDTTKFVATDGTKFTTQDAFTTYQANLNQKAADTRNAVQVLTDRFAKYGLSSLATKIQQLAIDGATEATITLQLQETPEYQIRFAANAARMKKGLTVLSPAEYLNAEDEYRQKLRDYGLKEFDNDDYVKQFIANDTSLTEISNRIVTAVQRVQNADPALMTQLKDYYGITQDKLVAYVLDPEQQFEKIKLQVSAGEIGVEARKQGLDSNVAVSEQLAKQGITQAEAQKGYSTIADILPTAEKLSDIYGKTLEGYRQSEGEQEVFNQLASAQRKRQKLSAAEIAQFSGSSGLSKTSLLDQAKGQF